MKVASSYVHVRQGAGARDWAGPIGHPWGQVDHTTCAGSCGPFFAVLRPLAWRICGKTHLIYVGIRPACRMQAITLPTCRGACLTYCRQWLTTQVTSWSLILAHHLFTLLLSPFCHAIWEGCGVPVSAHYQSERLFLNDQHVEDELLRPRQKRSTCRIRRQQIRHAIAKFDG